MAGAQVFGRKIVNKVFKMTDDEVRQARTMKEINKMETKEIAKHFDVEPTYMGKILSYEIRSRILIKCATNHVIYGGEG